MGIHNSEGVKAASAMGIKRVILERQVTMDEIKAIKAASPIEIELFIHGALCYSYSGLCMFSSMMRGRSWNRGRCTYPCRDFCRVEVGQAQGWFKRDEIWGVYKGEWIE